MFRLLSRLSKNLILAIPAVMVAGFLFGLAVPSGWLKTLIVPLIFLMVSPMMVSLKLAKVLEGGDSKAQLLAQVIVLFEELGETFGQCGDQFRAGYENS